MNKGNWQIKILTLFMGAIALCLTAACEPGQIEVERITPSAPCMNDSALTPSVEFVDLYEKWKNERELGEDATMEDLSELPGYSGAKNARADRLGPEYFRIVAMIRAKYAERIKRHPFYRGHVIWYLEDEKGWLTDTIVLEIDVHRMVSPYRFPPGDRIPECIEGVPVLYFLNRVWATF